MATNRITRRGTLSLAAGGAVLPLLPARPARAQGGVVTARIQDAGPSRPISPFLYGSNEVGSLNDLPSRSAAYDREVGVKARRFGGNFLTTFNWARNAANAGHDWFHHNMSGLGYLMGLRGNALDPPGAVVDATIETSLAMGARTLMTLPLSQWVAADRDGEVTTNQAAPSERWVPVQWTDDRAANDPVDLSVANVPHMIRRIVDRYGPSSGRSGVIGFALDNEPGLWSETHPRLFAEPMPIEDYLSRSVAAAVMVKSIDPSAPVFGPVSWGATGMATFQMSPDWRRYQAEYGSFLALYLSRFAAESERRGMRLLDVLDIHWYPFSDDGGIFRTEDPGMDRAVLDAPRTLTEVGFRERSWVPDVLPVRTGGGLTLPILPSLNRLIDEYFPGTRLAVTEFDYGGPGNPTAALAIADVLGRYASQGVYVSNHWNEIAGTLIQGYRLYTNYDGLGSMYAGSAVSAESDDPETVAVHAAVDSDPTPRLHVIVVNKSTSGQAVDLVTDRRHPYNVLATYGFDRTQTITGPIGGVQPVSDGPIRVDLPPRSARHFVLL